MSENEYTRAKYDAASNKLEMAKRSVVISYPAPKDTPPSLLSYGAVILGGSRIEAAVKKINELMVQAHEEGLALNKQYNKLLGDALKNKKGALDKLEQFEIEKLGIKKSIQQNRQGPYR
ncbi:MAG: hypothetical protein EXS55_02560 [Candidatus Magasanikbacteria bacterium]|nr:hypothetical protein [Candidatus Magasanikbacteria bacterium]